MIIQKRLDRKTMKGECTMKRFLSVIFAAVMTASMLGVTVSAHGGHHGSKSKSSIVYSCESGCKYTDADGDGICDGCGNYGYYCKKDCTYCDEDNDGICDNCSGKGVCSYKSNAKTRTKHCRH